ncbi:MAG: response regulator [Endomicrobiales bacterium]
MLVVDDENEAAAYIGRFVQRQGFEVFTAASGREALKLFEKNAPDCVFLDVSLPEMNGLSILEKMRESNPGARVYFVTGISGEAFNREAEQRGAAGTLTKPVDLNELLKVVKTIRTGARKAGPQDTSSSPSSK